MKKVLMLTMVFTVLYLNGIGQITSSMNGSNEGTDHGQEQKLHWGAYGEIKFSQQMSDDFRNNAKLDIHRVVLLMDYDFNSRLRFTTEIEVEHVKEIYLEQAYLNYKFNDYFQLKGGLILIPMGIVNERHEPPTFNGVNRPLVDKYIVPSTWREIGFGFTGKIKEVDLKYQAYVMNGFNSFDGAGTLSANNGLRKGRQKGAESYMSSPNFSANISFYGISNLNIGLSAFVGNSESTRFNGLAKDDEIALQSADSTVVGIGMYGLDLEYKLKGFQLKGQYIYGSIGNSLEYNVATDQNIGSSIYGYYAELNYDLFRLFENPKGELITFFRYENYNTQNDVAEGIVKEEKYDITQMTFGLGYKITPQAVVKADFQLRKSKDMDDLDQYLNIGLGFAF
jgi:hypothetical protein